MVNEPATATLLYGSLDEAIQVLNDFALIYR